MRGLRTMLIFYRDSYSRFGLLRDYIYIFELKDTKVKLAIYIIVEKINYTD